VTPRIDRTRSRGGKLDGRLLVDGRDIGVRLDREETTLRPLLAGRAGIRCASAAPTLER
jgi:hypothetical protein